MLSEDSYFKSDAANAADSDLRSVPRELFAHFRMYDRWCGSDPRLSGLQAIVYLSRLSCLLPLCFFE